MLQAGRDYSALIGALHAEQAHADALGKSERSDPDGSVRRFISGGYMILRPAIQEEVVLQASGRVLRPGTGDVFLGHTAAQARLLAAEVAAAHDAQNPPIPPPAASPE